MIVIYFLLPGFAMSMAGTQPPHYWEHVPVDPTVRRFAHFECRNKLYPDSAVMRQKIQMDQMYWDDEFKNYTPPCHTHMHSVYYKNYDPDIGEPNFKPKWNAIDGKLNRESFLGNYVIEESYPLNPIGRTGIRGRGLLRRWGPNHIVDAIVTRWKLNETDEIMRGGKGKLKILEFVAVLTRKQASATVGQKWALPSAMVDIGETPEDAVKREFRDEPMHSSNQKEQEIYSRQVSTLFEKKPNVVFTGYCDDARNTDNAWVETTVLHYHDEVGELINLWDLAHGDDKVQVGWMLLNQTVPVSETQHYIMSKLASKMNAFWEF